MSNKNNLLERKTKSQIITQVEENIHKDFEETIENINENSDTTFIPVKKKATNIMSIFVLLLVVFILVLLLAFSVFTIYNALNPNIISGISIKGINVSGLSPSDAKYQLDNYLKDKLPEEIKVKYKDFETTISLSQMDIEFDTKTASNSAFQIGREGNIFENNF